MNKTTFDLDDYISSKKEVDAEFAKDFDSGYEEFKIGMMIKEMRLDNILSSTRQKYYRVLDRVIFQTTSPSSQRIGLNCQNCFLQVRRL